MIAIFSSGDPYRVEAEASTIGAAVELCRSLERTTGDGCERAAYGRGRLVATSAGPVGKADLPPAHVIAHTRAHDRNLRRYAV